MRKILFMFIILVICISCKDNNTDVIIPQNLEITDSLYIGFDNVIDFTSDGQYYYFLTNSEIIKTSLNGSIISRENQEYLSGICFYNNELIKINEIGNIIRVMNDTLKTDTNSYNKLTGATKMKFLSYDGVKYYTCIFRSGFSILSYSDQIITVNDSGKAAFFEYFVGVPAGIFYKSNYIYYISNTQGPTETSYNIIKGYMMKYNQTGGLHIDEIEIPALAPIGIYIDNEYNYYIYSRYNKSIMKFREN